MAKSNRKTPKLTAAEVALVRDAMAIPPTESLPKLSGDALMARWKAEVAAEKSSTVTAFPATAKEEPLRIAARGGAKISKETEDRIRQLLKRGKPKPDGR